MILNNDYNCTQKTKKIMILIIGCTSKPFYALNGFGVYISETIPTPKWFRLDMWGDKKNKNWGHKSSGDA